MGDVFQLTAPVKVADDVRATVSRCGRFAPGSRTSLGGDGSSHFQQLVLAANVESQEQEVGEAAETAASV